MMKTKKVKRLEKRLQSANNRFAAMSDAQLSEMISSKSMTKLSDSEFEQFFRVYEKRFGQSINEPIAPGFEVVDDTTLDRLCAAIGGDGGTVEVTGQQAEFLKLLG